MEKIYYTIGEVSELLGEESYTIRFWSNEFSEFFKLKRNKKQNRIYREEDVERLKQIKHLLRVKKMKIDGVKSFLIENNRKIDKELKILESLKEIKRQLLEVQKEIED